jgi:uncharacterized protein YdhG (YjbR/CyaY superfamily)
MEARAVPLNIDEYIAGFPEKVQEVLEEVRAAIKRAAPEAEERISYQMPALILKGNVVYFAAYPDHIGFYPTTFAVESFRNELSDYKSSKGAIQFPIDKPMPTDLITRIAAFKLKKDATGSQSDFGKKST